MGEKKFLKATCRKTGLHFGLDVQKFGADWKVVNMVRISDEEAALTTSEVKQDIFETNDNLLPCSKCGSRKIGGCSCSKKFFQCNRSMKYKFDCVYCKEFDVDYSLPRASDIAKYKGKSVTLSQGKEVKIVTFSNVEWKKFDRVQFHPSGEAYDEPKVHVVANKKNIEFHGYNISRMDEGVYYVIDSQDDFVIACDVDTSKIEPHPGGHLYISFGAITAILKLDGGTFELDGKTVAQVGSKFHMQLSLIDHEYKIIINGEKKGAAHKQDDLEVRVVFGFQHAEHCCSLLSHAYMKEIEMQHGVLTREGQ